MSNNFENVNLVGTHFRGVDARNIVASFHEGLVVQLEREHDNDYDEYAIKTMYKGIHVGYIEKGQASWIAPDMDADPEQPWIGTVTSFLEGSRVTYPVLTCAMDMSE